MLTKQNFLINNQLSEWVNEKDEKEISVSMRLNLYNNFYTV